MKQSFRQAALAVTAAVGLAVFGQVLYPAPAQADEPTLNLFNWADYIDPALLTKFEAQCHCKVVESDYENNAEMEAKLRAGGDSQYDVVVPSNYVIAELVAEGLISPIDHTKLSNFGNLGARFQNPNYDPGDRYSIPYQWGTTGLIYDPAKIKSPPQSWAVLFDPKVNPSYPFVIPVGEGRGQIGAACAYLGYGFNCSEKSQWIAAAKLIQATKKRTNFAGFVDESPALLEIKKDIIAASIGFNGDIGSCYADGTCATLKYFIPREGSDMWVDTMAIPAHAPHPELALEFINFILDAHNGADLSNWNTYASPNEAAKPYLSASLLTPLYNPTPDELKRLVFLSPLSGAKLKLFDAIWTTVLQ